MENNAKIYIAGHRGLVGSAITRELKKLGHDNLLLRAHEELDLLNQKKVADFFAAEKPEYVFMAAAKVGGIYANNTFPAQFIYENLLIQNNIIHNSYINGVKKLLFLGSSCIYPRTCPQPIKEEYLLTSTLEKTNEPYAIAKITGIKMCQSYNRQYNTNFIAAMPTNLYGPNDNYDINNSHVLPALITKFHLAKQNNEKTVTLWGTGSPMREFLFVDDAARGSIYLMNNFNPTPEQNESGEIFFNLGTGTGISIKDLANAVKEVVGFAGEIAWDSTKPDGAPKRLLDVSRAHSIGWQHEVDLRSGIETTYQGYLDKLKK